MKYVLLSKAKRYNLTIGVLISLFISILSSIPRIIKAEELEYVNLLISVIYVFILAIFCWLFHQYMLTARMHWQLIEHPWIKYIISIAVGMGFSYLLHVYLNGFTNLSSFILDNSSAGRKVIAILFRGFLISGFTFLLAYYINLSKFTQKSILENEQLKKLNIQARIESLKQQISPHFLFNSLNTLSTLTLEPKVKEYVFQLSKVYRYLLRYKESDMVTLDEEIDFINSYLYILRERFENSLFLTVALSSYTLKTQLPPLALQMLVENALKHNVLSEAKPLHISIYSYDECIVISNNLQMRFSTASESSKFGLDNINERYKLLVNKEIIIEKDEHQFTVKLPVLT